MTIRTATDADVAQLVALSERKRQQYAVWQPVFHRVAEGASEKQRPFLQSQLTKENSICLVAEENGAVIGFVVASVHAAPPVYNPGGLSCGVDDFCVAGEGDWETAGRALLGAVWKEAKAQGAVQSVVVCGPQDRSKRDMLASENYSVASEWHVKDL